MNELSSTKADWMCVENPFCVPCPLMPTDPIASWCSPSWTSRSEDPLKGSRMPSSFANKLSGIVSLSFMGLFLASLVWAAPVTYEIDPPNSAAAGMKKTGELILRERAGREEILKKVRIKLAERIRKELVTLPQYSIFDNLGFRLDENEVVTLSGQVRLPSLKITAERAVKSIEGVRGIINQLEVLPTSFFDDDIRRVAYRRIYSQSQLSRYGFQAVPPIHIIVKQGKLTLEGAVASQSDRTIAGIEANQVSNVFEVVNNLRVEDPR
jgi:BON domain-containing protein